MLSTWRLQLGHRMMETKATCLGGEFVGRLVLGLGDPVRCTHGSQINKQAGERLLK